MRLIEDSLLLDHSIRKNLFMHYPEYCEAKLQLTYDEDGFCYKCKKTLEPLTYCDPDFYYQPCWDCCSKRKADREIITESLTRSIKDYYCSKILGDRYYQLFIVDEIYFNTTFPHTYSTFKKVVNSIDPPSRNEIWFLDWNPGYPKIISMENLPGIKIVNLTNLYGDPELGKTSIKVGNYEIRLPEETVFDSRHHARYSILNKSGDRRSKKIKIGEKCYKFYNTDDNSVKSIFKVFLADSGSEVAVRSLSKQDFVIIKLAIMRNKTFLRLVFDIILEICKSIGTLKDPIFLKNTVELRPKNNTQLNLMWTPISEFKDNEPGVINISII